VSRDESESREPRIKSRELSTKRGEPKNKGRVPKRRIAA
jgi:hypothetical protein